MTDQELGIFSKEIQSDGMDSYHMHRYEPTGYEVIDELFACFPLKKEDVFVDFGSGLGRVCFYATYRFDCLSTGVEMSMEYCERAEENKETFVGDSEKVTFCKSLADEYEIGDNENVFYLFNPFSPAIVRRVIRHIETSYEQCPRKIVVIFYYPEDEVIYFMENHTSFTLMGEYAASEEIAHNRRDRFCLYELK